MSVILFDPQELANLYREYEAINPKVYDAPGPEDMALALQAFHFANVSAYCLTYSDWAVEGSGLPADRRGQYEPRRSARRDTGAACPGSIPPTKRRLGGLSDGNY
jgi:hypothetical protein